MISYMIVGGNWGSEGKGLFMGFIANERKPDAVTCCYGPNSGHTWYEGDTPIVFKSLPVASVAKSVSNIFLGPGSVIDPEVLEKELGSLYQYISDKEIWVHEAAAIIMPGDKSAERAGVSHIASTMQGTSEAMIRKIRRQVEYPAKKALLHLIPRINVVNHNDYKNMMATADVLQIEGSQGMDLSINSGVTYPYVTSRDCTPAQVLADCGVHPRDLGTIYACIRTYPIRVGNIPGGHSGPCYPDQEELTWGQVGQAEEFTTVTKRVRRVFSFSELQIKKLIKEVRPTGIFLNFANYTNEWGVLMNKINLIAGRKIVGWTGHGPRHTDIRTHNQLHSAINPPQYQE